MASSLEAFGDLLPQLVRVALGGKDGVPFPVDREAMDQAISILQTSLENATISGRERKGALRRLKGLIPA